MQDFVLKLLFLVVFLTFFYGACAAVQLTLARPKMRYVVVGLFATVAALVLLLGLLSLAQPQLVPPSQGRLLLALGVATILPLLKPVRLLMARLTPFAPDSTVDISGLVVLLWALVIAGTVLFAIDLTKLADELHFTIADALTNVIAFPVIAFSLVGAFVTRSWRECVKRLGLEPLTARQAVFALLLAVPLFAVSFAADYVGRTLQPGLYAQVEAILKAISSGITSPLLAVIFGVCAGVGEEILFRGAIQPRFGIPLTSLVFALMHSQYGVSFTVVGVFLTGIVLGYERKYLNTTACIVTHAVYDIIAVLLNAGG